MMTGLTQILIESDLILIEVQRGDYLGEDDIVRIEENKINI